MIRGLPRCGMRTWGESARCLAVPVAPPGWEARMGGGADELACVQVPEPFFAIGQFYADFCQATDEEVVACP
jgi:putative phosphoribosyl transferase